MIEPPGHSFRYLLGDGRVLLGDSQEERDPLDVRAADRYPVVVRAALLPRPLGSREEVAVRDRLAGEGGSFTCRISWLLDIGLPRSSSCAFPSPMIESVVTLTEPICRELLRGLGAAPSRVAYLAAGLCSLPESLEWLGHAVRWSVPEADGPLEIGMKKLSRSGGEGAFPFDRAHRLGRG